MVRSREPLKCLWPSQRGTCRPTSASASRSHRPSRTSRARFSTQAQPSRTPRGSAGCSVLPLRGVVAGSVRRLGLVLVDPPTARRLVASALAPCAPDLVLDKLEILLRELVDVSLEGQRPVLRRPFADVLDPSGRVRCGHPRRL